MDDKLVSAIRIFVVSAIGATLTALSHQVPFLDQATAQASVEAVQLLITLAVYVAVRFAAERWPIVNSFLSLFLASNNSSPKFIKGDK